MSSPEEHDRTQRPPPYLDPGPIIDTRLREVERQQREDRLEQKQHSRDQLKVNKYIAGFTGLLFITSIVSNLMFQRQISIAKESADAARSAATTADESLKITKALTLGGHLKTGHTWPLQNRPTKLDQDKNIYNPLRAVSTNIFRNLA